MNPATATDGRSTQRRATRAEASRIEQRTLALSVCGVLAVALGSIAWGLVIEAKVVILNGVFSLLSMISGGLSLVASKLVVRPEDQRFPFGYAHVEPLVLTVNALVVLIMCIYAFINGIEGIRSGGHAVDAAGVVVFGAVSTAVCLGVGGWELAVSRRVGSVLLRNDAKEWLMDAGFSMATLLGFAVLPFLEEPLRGVWARYADPAMVAVLALLFVPVPIRILRRSLREVLLMTDSDDKLVVRVESALSRIQADHDIERAVHHVVRTGRKVFIEIDFVVGPRFALQTVAGQDTLRERIRSDIGLSLDEAWLSISFTANPRWT